MESGWDPERHWKGDPERRKTSNGPSETNYLRGFQEQKNKIKKTWESELDKIRTQQPKTTLAVVKVDLHGKTNRTREPEEKSPYLA
jgi:hypothetical protein